MIMITFTIGLFRFMDRLDKYIILFSASTALTKVSLKIKFKTKTVPESSDSNNYKFSIVIPKCLSLPDITAHCYQPPKRLRIDTGGLSVNCCALFYEAPTKCSLLNY